MKDFTTLISGRSYLENCRWHEGRFWASDLYAHEVLAVSMDGHVEVVASVPQQPAGLGWLPNGDLLIVSMIDRKLMRRLPGGELVVHADLSSVTGSWLSDMVVSPRGDAYLGPVGFDVMASKPEVQPTTTFHVTPDGTVRAHGADILLPNGHAISPDGKTLVLSESFGARLTAFNISEDGSLAGQRIWADFGGRREPVGSLEEYIASGVIVPDGLCFDAEGALWMADAYNGRALRVREGGEILDEVKYRNVVPSVTLGGEDGRTLFLCSSESSHDEYCKATHTSEVVYTRVDVPHGGYP